MIKLRGAFTAMITPMKGDGSVDYEGFRKHIKNQLEGGINGLVPLCTTSETPTLDEDEEEKMIEIIMNEVRSWEKAKGVKVPVIIGAGSNNTRDAVRYTERAKKAGADAALVVTPYYNKPSKEGLFRHFEAVSKVGIPIIVYNIPSRTGVNIEPATFVELAKHPRIAAIKEASGNISQVAKLAKQAGGILDIYSGNDDQVIPILSLGGIGVISVLSNVAPKAAHDMVMEYLEGDRKKAAALQLDYLDLINALFCEVNPIPVKGAMNLMGYNVGKLRLPLTEIEDAHRELMKKCLKEAGLIA